MPNPKVCGKSSTESGFRELNPVTESTAGGWNRYVGDHFSREVNIGGHNLCLFVDRRGEEYTGGVVDYDAPIGKGVFFLSERGGLIQTKRRVERLALELDLG